MTNLNPDLLNIWPECTEPVTSPVAMVCLNCGNVSYDFRIEPGSLLGDEGTEVLCDVCGAIHEIVADGYILTGEFEKLG